MKIGKGMTGPTGTQSGSTIFAFHKEYFQWIVLKMELNDLHSYKNVFGQRVLVYHKQ